MTTRAGIISIPSHGLRTCALRIAVGANTCAPEVAATGFVYPPCAGPEGYELKVEADTLACVDLEECHPASVDRDPCFVHNGGPAPTCLEAIHARAARQTPRCAKTALAARRSCLQATSSTS